MGIALALELKRRHPDLAVTLIEKEPGCGRHASGRNSGVLHAGFYYSADSLKAQFTGAGNRQLAAYCEARGLRLVRCGKLVVARTAADLPALTELLRRARTNGVPLEVLSADEARQIEPRARTCERALYSPSTAVVDPGEVVASLVGDLRAAGVAVLTGTAYLGRRGAEIRTSTGAISAGYVINAAGLYADRIARDFGFSERYRIVPFRGGYLRAGPETPGFRTHIYPAPDLRYPFLGVHIIRTVAGGAKIGPTATPAFWREHYEGWDRFSLAECLTILRVELGLVVRNNCGFRRLAVRELLRSNRRALLLAAQGLAAGIRAADFRASGTPGIRAQLVDLRNRTLEMDFRSEGDDRSFHLLNAVSPAFTCALPFSAYLVDRIEELVGSRRAPQPDDQAAAHRP